MRKFIVEVTQIITVELDESKFDEKFMQEFREYFYDFNSIEEHAEHLAQLAARGFSTHDFIEGYGKPSDMKIRITNENDVRTEVVG